MEIINSFKAKVFPKMGIGVGPGGSPRRFQIKCQKVKSAIINGKNIANILKAKLKEGNNDNEENGQFISLNMKKLWFDSFI